jgi:hypothetical protein
MHAPAGCGGNNGKGEGGTLSGGLGAVSYELWARSYGRRARMLTAGSGAGRRSVLINAH